MRLSFLFASLIVMQGCAAKTTAPAPEANTQNLSKEQPASYETKNPKLSNLAGKNYIKGIVTGLHRDSSGQTWNYVIEGIDTTNGKLPYVNFNNKTVLANEGDLVHASFDGNKLTQMLVIKEGFFKNGKRQEVVPAPKKSNLGEKSAGKRDKAHQILAVPQEESIRLN